jgi:hypothetical protein
MKPNLKKTFALHGRLSIVLQTVKSNEAEIVPLRRWRMSALSGCAVNSFGLVPGVPEGTGVSASSSNPNHPAKAGLPCCNSQELGRPRRAIYLDVRVCDPICVK